MTSLVRAQRCASFIHSGVSAHRGETATRAHRRRTNNTKLSITPFATIDCRGDAGKIEKNMGNKMTKEEQDAKELKKSPFQRLLARFQMCPNKPEKWSPKKGSPETKAQALPPPPKPPLRNHAERMQSDDKEDLKKAEWTEVPLQVPDSPPNGSYRGIISTIPVPPPRKHKMRIQEILEIPKKIKNVQVEITPSSAPVEEPIIIPKKVIEHVCDGTHHHVHNVVDGKVVDQIIAHKEIKQNKTAAKNASSLSLPSHEDLKKKVEKRARSPTKSAKNKSSASSLPTDKKQKHTNSAAEKLESYMIRCKSIGSIIPHQKTEKSKSIEHDSDNESADSWGGLEDWDLGIIEHDVSVDVPQVPFKNVREKQNEVNNKRLEKDTTKTSNKVDTKELDFFITSIDDEITSKSKLPTITTEKISPSQLGTYPFKRTPVKSAFENDAFFTTELLRNESLPQNNSEHNKPDQVKMAPLAAFDSDKESEKDAPFDPPDYKKTVVFSLNDNKEMPKVTEVLNSHDITPFEQNRPSAKPRRKSSTGHSNLLKFISNTSEVKDKDASQKIKFTDEKSKEIEETQEPEIVPELRNLDRSWQHLIKSDEINNTSLLEQESSISDLIETSSDDTRSTTIETALK